MYFPKSQIITDLYTNGNEFIFPNTTNEYVGNYFQTSDAALRGVPGIYTHNSYRTDKIDAIPQRELLLLLNEFN